MVRIPLPLLKQIVENPTKTQHEYTTDGGNLVVATRIDWVAYGKSGTSFDFVWNPDD